MKIIFNYNFRSSDIADYDYHALYSQRRRDAVFAFAFEEEDGSVIALRDHLGNVPLYYRVKNGNINCSAFLPELIETDDVINSSGLNTYLAIGSAKAKALVDGLGIIPPGAVMRIKRDGNREVLFRYRFNLQRGFNGSFSETVDEFDRLMIQAIKRVVVADTVGVYLSGGIDSALIGLYLKKAGVKIHAYTSLPWGETGTEAKYARINAKTFAADKHELISLETKDYQNLIEKTLDVYANPRGLTSQIGIISLWQNSAIGQEKQIFCGHNADTLVCSMPSQYQIFVASFLPRFIRRRLHRWIGWDNYRQDYLSTISRTRFTQLEIIDDDYLKTLSRIKALTIMGMLIGHTGEGEAFSLPVIRAGKIFSDPYFDLDLIEFGLNLPLRYRLSFSRHKKTFIFLEKKIARALALKYLPPELVYRKKGMTVPVNRDQISKNFFTSLPKEIGGLKLNDPEERLAAKVLFDFVKKYSLRFSPPKGNGNRQ